MAPAYYSAESSNYETANIPVEVGRSTLVQCLCWATQHHTNSFKYMSFQVVQTQKVTNSLTSSAVQCNTMRQYIRWQNYEYLCTFIFVKKSLTYPLHS